MIPIRNKKKSLKVTVEEMRNFAFNYVEKYAPSKQQLKTYLLKKYLKGSATTVKKKDLTNLIDVVLSDLEKGRFIDDKFYCCNNVNDIYILICKFCTLQVVYFIFFIFKFVFPN